MNFRRFLFVFLTACLCGGAFSLPTPSKEASGADRIQAGRAQNPAGEEARLRKRTEAQNPERANRQQARPQAAQAAPDIEEGLTDGRKTASAPAQNPTGAKKASSKKPAPAAKAGGYRTVEKVLFPLGEEMVSLSDRNQAEKELRAGLVLKDNLIFAVFPVQTLLSDKSALEDFLIAQKIIDLSLKEEADGETPFNKTSEGGAASDFQPDKKEERAALQRIQGKSSSQSMRKRLRKAGLSPKLFRAQTTQSLKRDFFIRQKFASKIIIAESDIERRLLQARKGAPVRPPLFEYEFRFISFDRTEEGLKQAREAEKALPQSFESRYESQGGKNKQRLKSGEISPPIEKALQGLSLSQFSPLTSIGDKIYIFRLDWKTAVYKAAEDRERQKIRAALLREALQKDFKQWLKEKKSLYSLSRKGRSA